MVCAQIEASEAASEGADKKDSFIQRYRKHAAQQQRDNYDYEELVHVVTDLLLAGVATSSTTLLYMITFLVNRIDLQVGHTHTTRFQSSRRVTGICRTNDGVEQEQTYILHPMKNFNVYDM